MMIFSLAKSNPGEITSAGIRTHWAWRSNAVLLIF